MFDDSFGMCQNRGCRLRRFSFLRFLLAFVVATFVIGTFVVGTFVVVGSFSGLVFALRGKAFWGFCFIWILKNVNNSLYIFYCNAVTDRLCIDVYGLWLFVELSHFPLKIGLFKIFFTFTDSYNSCNKNKFKLVPKWGYNNKQFWERQIKLTVM